MGNGLPPGICGFPARGADLRVVSGCGLVVALKVRRLGSGLQMAGLLQLLFDRWPASWQWSNRNVWSFVQLRIAFNNMKYLAAANIPRSRFDLSRISYRPRISRPFIPPGGIYL
jgi:hypothetical protein